MRTRSGISAELCKRHTLLDVTSKATPSGINATPTANSTGRTVPAVMIGCHAGSFCCLNFVSVHIITPVKQLNHTTRVQAVTCHLHADDNCIGRGATKLVVTVNEGKFSACTDIHLESYMTAAAAAASITLCKLLTYRPTQMVRRCCMTRAVQTRGSCVVLIASGSRRRSETDTQCKIGAGRCPTYLSAVWSCCDLFLPVIQWQGDLEHDNLATLLLVFRYRWSGWLTKLISSHVI